VNHPVNTDLVQALNQVLPQTQCTRCGYPSCLDYAQAVAAGQAPINQCPPGGLEGVKRLAAITGQPVLPLNPHHGVEGPRQLAVIDETWCIGCTLCINACPVDAIFGAAKHMHSVLNAQCTGCELCVPVCPVDCIDLISVTNERTGWQAWSAPQADEARQRFERRQERVQRVAAAQQTRAAPLNPAVTTPAANDKRAAIQAAMARARAARGSA
jgi:Na+-translocating ferredoxin:NAD+ oxidoreductase subunit B